MPGPENLHQIEQEHLTEEQLAMSEIRADAFVAGEKSGAEKKNAESLDAMIEAQRPERERLEKEIDQRVTRVKQQIKEQNIETGDIVDIVFGEFEGRGDNKPPAINAKFGELPNDSARLSYHELKKDGEYETRDSKMPHVAFIESITLKRKAKPQE